MKKYKKWSKELYDNIIEDVKEAILKDTVNYIYLKMQEIIQEVVYDAYDPIRYKRRGFENGGLGDMSQFDFDIDFNNKGFTLKVYTNSKGNGFDKNSSLDKYIVEGIYQYEPSPDKRDFYTALEDNLRNDTIFRIIIKESLKKKGINIKG